MKPPTRRLAGVALLVAAALITIVSRFASKAPDGLTRVATDNGMASAPSHEPLLSYGPASGLVGALVVLLLVSGLMLLLRKGR